MTQKKDLEVMLQRRRRTWRGRHRDLRRAWEGGGNDTEGLRGAITTLSDTGVALWNNTSSVPNASPGFTSKESYN